MPLEACWFGTQPNFRNITRTRQPFCSALGVFFEFSPVFSRLICCQSNGSEEDLLEMICRGRYREKFSGTMAVTGRKGRLVFCLEKSINCRF